METIGAYEAKTHLGQLLTRVHVTHEPIMIRRRGRNVAVLESYEAYAARLRRGDAEAVVTAFRRIRDSARCDTDSPPGTARELIDDGRKR